MLRLARLDDSGVLHHVMGRGIEKREIFLNNENREDFLERLAAMAQEKALDVYARSLMPNHPSICQNRVSAPSIRYA